MRRLVVLVVFLCCLLLVAGAGVGAEDPVANETFPPHEHPDEIAEDGDLNVVESWLSEALGDRLGESAIELSDSDFELARAVLGSEYEAQIDQLEEIDRDPEAFADAQSDQIALVDAVEAFESNLDAYEQRIAAGDEAGARDIARELALLADEIEGLAEAVLGDYERVEEQFGIDLSFAAEEITFRSTTTRQQTDVVLNESLDRTQLIIDIIEERASFTDPMTITGIIETEDGAPVANENATLEIGHESFSVTTDASGRFSVEHQPVLWPIGVTEVTVRYVPEAGAEYLGSEGYDTVRIDQIRPEVTELTSADEVAFGDETTVEGLVSVDGEPVPTLPIDILLSDVTLDSVNISEGTLFENVSIPADIASGTQQLTVRHAASDLAIGPVEESIDVEVVETETTLELESANVDEASVAIAGTLQTTEGLAVPDQSIVISQNEQVVERVETDSSGAFDLVLDAPETGDNETVVAEFDGTGTNLESASAEQTITAPVVGETSTLWETLTSLLEPILVLLIVLAATAGMIWHHRQSANRPDEESPSIGERIIEVIDEPEEFAETVSRWTPGELLDQATNRLDGGDTRLATVLGYAAVRLSLTQDNEQPLTHREFLQRYREQVSGHDLETVTEGFEKVVFAERKISRSEALPVVASAVRLCDGPA